MTSKELINKITQKADTFRLQASLKCKGQHHVDVVPYKEVIVTNDKFPGFYFLVTENMIFKSNSLNDSCYEVYSFNKEGEYKRKEKVEDLGKSFFTTMKVVKEL